MDKALVFGTNNGGSIPPRGTDFCFFVINQYNNLMSAKKTIYLILVLFMLGVVLLPNIALAINHEYVGCGDKYEGAGDSKKRVSSGIDKATGKCADGQERMVCYEGIVPCGKSVTVDTDNKLENDPKVYWDKDNKVCAGTKEGETKKIVNCQLCHFFVIIDSIMDFIMVDIVPPLTVAVLVIGGALFYFSGAKPELRNKSVTLFKNVLIGLVLIYGAYMIVGIFLMILGAAEMNPLKSIFDSSKGIFSITCPIEVP